MARISFESLPEYAVVGGRISGVLVVETDKPIDANRVTVTLRGSEIVQVRSQQPSGGVGVGKPPSSVELVQTVGFLEQNVLPVSMGQVGPGTVRLPFSFDLPADAPPSLSTTPLPASRGRIFRRPDGCYVEYELEGRIEVPWWISPMDRELLPVFATRRVLGTVAPVRVPADGGRPSVLVEVDSPTLYPGQHLAGSFQISNPAGKRVRSITLGIQRCVQYAARGASGESFGPTYGVTVPIDSRETTRAGRFDVEIPNTTETTGPGQGSLYRTFWNFTVHLDVALGSDVMFSAPLQPA